FGRQSTNPTDIVLALNMTAVTHMMQRNPVAAEANAAEALAIAEKHDLTAYANMTRVPLAWARAHFGQAEQSVAIVRASIAGMLASGDRNGAGDSLLRLAQVLNVAGMFAEALATVELFLKDYPDHVIIRPNGLHLRGELRLKLGQSELAETDFRDAIEFAQKIGTKP